MLYDLVSYRLHCLVLFILVWLSGMLYQPVVHSLLYSAAIMLEAKACGSDLASARQERKKGDRTHLLLGFLVGCWAFRGLGLVGCWFWRGAWGLGDVTWQVQLSPFESR